MTFKWGTVTSIGPLRITLDGDTTALPFTPDSLVDPMGLVVNDRVRCELSSRRVIIIGRSGGLVPDSGWLPYNPAWANVTVGNGTTWGRYRRRGHTVEWAAWLQMGSTSAMGTTPWVALPAPPSQTAPVALEAQILDSGNTWFDAMPVWGSGGAGTVSLFFSDSSGASAKVGTVTATAPMVWAVSDWIRVGGVYEAI